MLALNGDELLDVDFNALLAEHEQSGAGATIVVAQVRSPFGVVDLQDDGRVTGFREAPLLDDWVNSGVYVLGEEALARLPEKGDHEQSTFPELAAEGKLRGFRHQRRLADRQHAEGPAARGGLHGRASGVAAAEGGHVSVDSPNFEGLDRWAFEPRRVEKPWGWELIWADTELYVGKILWVRAGLLAQPPVPQREGRELVRPERQGDARARRGGAGRPRTPR